MVIVLKSFRAKADTMSIEEARARLAARTGRSKRKLDLLPVLALMACAASIGFAAVSVSNGALSLSVSTARAIPSSQSGTVEARWRPLAEICGIAPGRLDVASPDFAADWRGYREAVTCMLRTDPGRLCEWRDRRDVTERVRWYFVLHDNLTRRGVREEEERRRDSVAVLGARGQLSGRQILDLVNEPGHDTLVALLRDTLAKGLLTPVEFGDAPGESARRALRNVSVASNRCA
jgi:hypothetical protein